MINKIKNAIVKNAKWIILFIALFAFTEIVEDLFHDELYNFDTTIYNIVSSLNNSFMTTFFKIITEFGDFFIIAFICLLIFIFVKNKKYGLYTVLNLGAIVILNQIMKIIFLRDRPIDNRLIDVSGYSFPSGHSMVSVAFYGFLIYVIYKKIENKTFKAVSIIFLGLLILLIGLSRIYLGVHYASDVLAGFCISVVYIILFTNFVFKNKSIV